MRKGLFGCAVLAALALGVVACEPPLPDYVGVWEGSDLPTPGFHYDAVMTLAEDGTYESLLYDVGGSTLQQGSSRGTYTVAGGAITVNVTQLFDGAAWQSVTMVSTTACTLAGDTLTMSIDFTGDGVPDNDWVLTRQ